MYDYRPLSEISPSRPARLEAFVRRYGLFLVAALAFVIVTALAFWEGPLPEDPNLNSQAYGSGGWVSNAAPGGVAGDQVMSDRATGLSVVTFPTGADVSIEFEPVGTSPLDQVELDAGSYFLSISKAGYVPLDTLVFVDVGQVNPVYVLLQREDGARELTLPPLATAPPPPSPSRAAPDRNAPRTPARPSPAPERSSPSRPSPNAAGRDARARADEPARRAPAVPPKRSEPASTGTVSVRSEPSGATVLLNGQVLGTTPTTLYRVTPDEYTLALELGGFATHSERVDVQAGEEAAVQARLVPSSGEVEVIVRPWGSIFIDGTLHRSDTDVVYRTSVPAGTRAIRVTHPSLGSRNVTVDVPAGGTKRVVVDLNELR